jgi:signal transduction histidine kinase
VVAGELARLRRLTNRMLLLASEPGDLARIFGRFARAEPYRSREAGGFGLGLPIVQAIAEAHHGSVRVRSTNGHGATFEMVIPAAGQLPGR